MAFIEHNQLLRSRICDVDFVEFPGQSGEYGYAHHVYVIKKLNCGVLNSHSWKEMTQREVKGYIEFWQDKRQKLLLQ